VAVPSGHDLRLPEAPEVHAQAAEVRAQAPDLHAEAALGGLRSLAENSPRRELSIERIDAEAALNSPLRSRFEQAGFAREYLGLTLRVPPLAHPQARSA